jgi:hypothetical protein
MFVNEVSATLDLLSIQLAAEVEVQPGTDVLPMDGPWITSESVQRLP